MVDVLSSLSSLNYPELFHFFPELFIKNVDTLFNKSNILSKIKKNE